MRPCLRPVVEAEHGLDDAVQLIGQVDRSRPASIGPSVVLELLQIHTEGAIELSDRPGQDNGSPRQILLCDGEAVLIGEFLDCGQVGGIRSELLRERLARDVNLRLRAGSQVFDAALEFLGCLAAHQHRDFQPFRGVGLAKRPRTRQRIPMAARKKMLRHGMISVIRGKL